MKYIYYLTISMILMGLDIAYAQPAIDFSKNEETNFEQMRKKYNDYWSLEENQSQKGWKQFRRWEYFWETRVKEDGTFPNAIDIYEAMENFKENTPVSQADKKWINLGPEKNPQATQSGIGRVNVIRFKSSNRKEIWLGAASGGVWSTKDGGNSWRVFDFTQSLSLGISDIAFCESNENVAYVATGDADGIGASYSTYSAGVLKTTDNGNSWAFTKLAYELNQGKIVTSLIVHPDNPNYVIAASSGGILKTTDGGESWRVKTSETGYFRALSLNPDDRNIIIATTYSNGGTSSIYRTTDFGETWVNVKTLNGVRRTAIDFAPGNGNYAYALATSGSYFHSFLKSTDAGKTWVVTANINNTPNILGLNQGTGNDRTRGQGWYDLAIAVSPYDENVVYTGGINIWRTENGGSTFTLTTHWTGSYSKPYVHADIHCLEFDLYSGFLYSGGDGGIDYANYPTSKWINLNKNLPITQYYKIAVASDRDNFVYGGAQDNGTHQLNAGNWKRVYGGDGMDCVVDYTDYKRAIISIYYGSFYKTINGVGFYKVLDRNETRENAAWVAPIMINPINPKSYYTGYQNLWKSGNAGYDWSRVSSINIGTLLNMAISKRDTNYIYVSSSSTLSKSSDGGRTFTNIPGAPAPIKGITVSSKDPNRIWVAVGGFSNNKVLMYDGKSWENISGNIPNVPVNCIIEQEDSPDRLYIGTDIGPMFSDYNSAYWEFYGSGIPNVIVSDIEIDYRTKRLFIGTYGRGVWVTDLNMCNLSQPEIEVDGETAICSGETIKLTALTDETNIVWTTGETTKSILVDKEGIYSYALPDIDGCSVRSKSVSIKVNKVPNIKIKPSGTYPICEGDSIGLKLSASFGFSNYLWSTGDTTRRITVDKPGNYSVIGYTKDDCEAKTEINLEVNPKPEKPVITRWTGTELVSSPAFEYQWYLDDKSLSGETNRNIIINSLGNYKVQTFNEQQCYMFSEPMEIITDVEEISEGNVKIYPNPTTGNLVVELLDYNSPIQSLSLTDILGNLIVSKTNIDKRVDLDMTNNPAGVYLLKIIINDNVIIKRIIKQ